MLFLSKLFMGKNDSHFFHAVERNCIPKSIKLKEHPKKEIQNFAPFI